MNIAFAIMFCNKADQTIKCLESLKGETIYLLNNGSDKEATEVVKEYIKGKEDLIYYYAKDENVGVSAGRNILIKLIPNEWMFFIDNDITIQEDNWKSILEKKMKQNPRTKIFSLRINNVHLGRLEKFYKFRLVGNSASFQMFDSGRTNKISGGACVVHKSIFEEYGLYDEGFFVGFEDYEFSIRAIKKGKPLDSLCVPEITLLHDHKKATREGDNQYLDVRYNEERIRTSYERIKQLHGITLPDDGVRWSKAQAESMKSEITQHSSTQKKRKGVTRIMLYALNQARIGGIETFNENFCKRLSKYYDITFVCHTGDPERLRRMSEYADIVFYKGQELETDIFIHAVAWGVRPKKVTAKRVIQMVHGDYEWMKNALQFTYEKLPQVTDHIAVGDYVKNQFEKITGEKAVTIYNLLNTDVKVQKILHLISVTRIGKEKGFHRVEIMAQKLREAGVKFIWHIWGDGTIPSFEQEVKNKLSKYQEIVFMGASEDTASYVADADYLVALSDSEGFSYSTYEALQIGTPCIITDYPSGAEQVIDGVNGWILKKDMSNLDIEKIVNTNLKGFKFEEKASEQDWIKLLGGASSKPLPKKKKTEQLFVKAKVLKTYRDVLLERTVSRGEELIYEQSRANILELQKLVQFIGFANELQNEKKDAILKRSNFLHT